MGNTNEEVKDLFIKDEDGNEIVDPNLSDKEEEKETPSESSTEETTEEAEETEEPEEETEEEPVKPQPKPVEGETPREKALRLEIERLRKANRGEKTKELFGKEEPSHKTENLDDDILSQYDPEEIKNFDRLFDAMAKSKGLVKKDEINASASDDVLDDFLNQHSEYLPENDPDNALWNRFRDEFNLYKKPLNPKDLKKILDKVHQDLFPSKPINTAAVAAQQAKIKTAAHGGTTVPKQSARESKVDPSLRAHLKGFSEDELEELLS